MFAARLFGLGAFTSVALRAIRHQTRQAATANYSVLVLGCGITGAATYRELRKLRPDWSITLWDKAREAGGRMNTSRTRQVPGAHADLGAQYLSPTPAGAQPDIYATLEEAGVIVPLPQSCISGDKYSKPGQKHFVAPAGVSSIVKHMLQPAITNGNVMLSKRAVRIDRSLATTGPSGVHWRVTDSDGGSCTFDAVVATMPIPQLLGTHPLGLSPECDLVKNLIRKQHPGVTATLEKVRYSSRFVAAVHYGPDAWPAILKDTQGGSWALRYVGSEDDALVFVSIDNVKRVGGDVVGAAKQAISAGQGPTVMMHSAVPWSIQQLKDGQSHKDVGRELVQRVVSNADLLPSLRSHNPLLVKSMCWKYSQVREGAYPDDGAILLGGEGGDEGGDGWPPIVVCGDGITASNFDNCCRSGHSAAHLLGDSSRL